MHSIRKTPTVSQIILNERLEELCLLTTEILNISLNEKNIKKVKSYSYKNWMSEIINKKLFDLENIISESYKTYFINTISWEDYLKNRINNLVISGFGSLKKKKIFNKIRDTIYMSIKIYESSYCEIFKKAIFNKWMSVDDIINLINANNITNFNYLELACLNFSKKHRSVLLHLIEGLDNKEVALKLNISSERVRQIGNISLSNTNFKDAVNYYKDFEEFSIQFKDDERKVFIDKKREFRKGAKSKKFIEILKDQFNLKINSHIYFDVYKNKPKSLKNKYKYQVKSFFIKRYIYNEIKEDIERFYNLIFKENCLININKIDKNLIRFLSKYKDLIFDTSYVHFTKKYIYLRSKITVEDLMINAFDSLNKKTLTINEIYDWIKENFPQKTNKSVDGIRGAILNSKKIISFGKTGNYGLAKNFGIKKNSQLSTKNLIIEILKKYSNPITEDIIEEYAMKRNPFLKERSVSMIIEINPKIFTKFSYKGNKELGRSYVGLKEKKYLNPPKNFNVTELNNYLKSKNTDQEWVSLKQFIEKYKIPQYQIKDYLIKKNYMEFKNMVTMSTGDRHKNDIILRLIQDENLIRKINTYLDLTLQEKTKFKFTLKKIIRKNFGIELTNDEISKIINFII